MEASKLCPFSWEAVNSNLIVLGLTHRESTQLIVSIEVFLYARSVLLNRVYRIPKCISNQNQSIHLRKGIQRAYHFDLGSFFNSNKYDCEKIDSTYFLSYFPWQNKLTILSRAKPTRKLRNCTFLLRNYLYKRYSCILLITKSDCSS